VGLLLPGRDDVWWDVEPDTDLAALGAALTDVLRHRVLAWFDELATFELAAQVLRDRPSTFGIASLSRLALLCDRAGYPAEAAAARAAEARVRAESSASR
jgi:hypothetical protein